MYNMQFVGAPVVHRLVEEAVVSYEPRIAVVAGNTAITYQQLNERADQLCRAILHYAPAATVSVLREAWK
jgi:non-ribosomal peptide synthetase component F